MSREATVWINSIDQSGRKITNACRSEFDLVFPRQEPPQAYLYQSVVSNDSYLRVSFDKCKPFVSSYFVKITFQNLSLYSASDCVMMYAEDYSMELQKAMQNCKHTEQAVPVVSHDGRKYAVRRPWRAQLYKNHITQDYNQYPALREH